MFSGPMKLNSHSKARFPEIIPKRSVQVLSYVHIFDVNNWNTDDTGLTDNTSTSSVRIFFCFAEKFGLFRQFAILQSRIIRCLSNFKSWLLV
jgi:hypothetical protein